MFVLLQHYPDFTEATSTAPAEKETQSTAAEEAKDHDWARAQTEHRPTAKVSVSGVSGVPVGTAMLHTLLLLPLLLTASWRSSSRSVLLSYVVIKHN